MLKLTQHLNVSTNTTFDNWFNLHYSTYNTTNNFPFLLSSDFLSFFKQLNIDTPKCFDNANSAKRKVNHLLVLKLSNYIMRGGNKASVNNKLVSTLHRLNTVVQPNNIVGNLSWFNSYSMLSQFISSSSYYTISSKSISANSLGSVFDINGLKYNSALDVRYKTSAIVNALKPIFLFYIYKVDKNIYKNSRGKSGKFTFLWKYISPFKRNKLILHWLSKELINTTGKTLTDRMLSLLKSYLTRPDTTFIFKIRRFTHNYVFSNCKNTLASTYRTTTK